MLDTFGVIDTVVERRAPIVYSVYSAQSKDRKSTNLELGVALEQQDIYGTELLHVAVFLELLANLGADGGYGHVQRVHGLDLGGLFGSILLIVSLPVHQGMIRYDPEPSDWVDL
jgi:hypothetical protein